ncbi:unnamed protein product, partial [Rotaria sp. Silwood2]
MNSPFQHPVCDSVITFRCEERINRYPLAFPCGNGQFLQQMDVPNDDYPCPNWRNDEVALTMLTSLDHIKDIKCRQAFRYSLFSNRSY